MLSNFGLGDRVVDVDRREQQRAVLPGARRGGDAGGGLLGDALDRGRHPGEALRARPRGSRAARRGSPSPPRSPPSRGRAPRPAASYSTPRWTSRVASPPSSSSMFGPLSPSGPGSGQLRAWPVHHQYSASVSPFQAKTGTPCGSSAVPGARPRPRPRRGPGSRRCCSEPSAPRRRGRPASRSGRRSARSCGGEPVIRAPCSGCASRELRAESPSGPASRARRAGSPCGRTRPGRGRRP